MILGREEGRPVIGVGLRGPLVGLAAGPDGCRVSGRAWQLQACAACNACTAGGRHSRSECAAGTRAGPLAAAPPRSPVARLAATHLARAAAAPTSAAIFNVDITTEKPTVSLAGGVGTRVVIGGRWQDCERPRGSASGRANCWAAGARRAVRTGGAHQWRSLSLLCPRRRSAAGIRTGAQQSAVRVCTDKGRSRPPQNAGFGQPAGGVAYVKSFGDGSMGTPGTDNEVGRPAEGPARPENLAHPNPQGSIGPCSVCTACPLGGPVQSAWAVPNSTHSSLNPLAATSQPDAWRRFPPPLSLPCLKATTPRQSGALLWPAFGSPAVASPPGWSWLLGFG